MVYLIRITCEGSASAARLDGVLKRVLPPGEYVEITGPEGLLTIKDKLRGQVCIFTVSLGPGGMNTGGLLRLFIRLRSYWKVFAAVLLLTDRTSFLPKRSAESSCLSLIGRGVCFPANLLSRQRDRSAILMYRPACCNQALPRPIKQR